MHKLFKLTLIFILHFMILTSCDTKISDLINIMDRGNIICVDQNATGSGSGESWKDACTSISQAVSIAKDGDEIWIAGDYVQSIDGLVVSKDLTFVGGFSGDEETESEIGNKKTTLTGSGYFNIQGDVKFKNFNVNTGNTNGPFFSISNCNNFYIYKSVFENIINSGAGGVILSTSPDLNVVIIDCKFSNCESGDATYGGGVITFNQKTNLIIKNSEFYANNAENNGGVVYIFGSNVSDTNINVSTSKFIGNYADNGGVIYVDSTASDVDINILNGCYLEGNYASVGDGGVVFLAANNSLTISGNCNFIDNGLKEGGMTQLGGAIVNFGNMSKSDNCIFSGNEATGSGGVIFNESGSTLTVSDLCIFENNKTYSSGSMGGGAIYNKGNLLISDNCMFNNNFTEGSGGAINNTGDLIISDSCIFENNRVDSIGGAIFSNAGNLSISYNCIFNSNFSSGGGAIHANQGSVSIKNNCMFFYNIAEVAGGAIFANICDEVTISDCSFYNNIANSIGKSIYMYYVVARNNIISDNNIDSRDVVIEE